MLEQLDNNELEGILKEDNVQLTVNRDKFLEIYSQLDALISQILFFFLE